MTTIYCHTLVFRCLMLNLPLHILLHNLKKCLQSFEFNFNQLPITLLALFNNLL